MHIQQATLYERIVRNLTLKLERKDGGKLDTLSFTELCTMETELNLALERVNTEKVRFLYLYIYYCGHAGGKGEQN